MRRWVKMLLLGAVFTVLLCTSALAVDDTAKGIHSLTETDSSLDLTAKMADGTCVTTTTEGKDGTAVYNGTEQVGMTYTGVSSGECLVFALSDNSGVPTENNIVYINQAAATASGVSFDIYPKNLISGKTYYIYVSGTEKQLTEVGSFEYYAPYKLGDINGNNRIQANDALLVLKHVAGSGTLDETQRLAADTNKNGRVQANDALLILKHVAGSITLS